MKKTFLPVALATLLCAMNVSCQKENMNDPITGVAETRAAYKMRILY